MLLYRAAGALAWLVMFALIVGGFFAFEWWIPIVAWIATSLIVGRCFTYFPAGVLYAVYGFPLAIALVVAWLLVR